TNKKEVYFRLTPLGITAEQEHDRFHEQAYNNVQEYLDQLKPNQINALVGFLDIYIDNLPSD
ncbi:MAG: MarR family transcriptional regulator, partial [Eubacterium sp.]